MKVRALRAITVRARYEQLYFEAGDVKNLEPQEAALAIVNASWGTKSMECPLKFEGTVPPWPGSFVTWASENGIKGPATVLMYVDVKEEQWILVLDLGPMQSHLVRQKDVLDVNPNPVLTSLFLIIEHAKDEREQRVAFEILENILRSIRECD
jgi:hypothetical protein